jgi:hypothetical protein
MTVWLSNTSPATSTASTAFARRPVRAMRMDRGQTRLRTTRHGVFRLELRCNWRPICQSAVCRNRGIGLLLLRKAES